MSYSQQYLEYLQSKTWKQRRLAALERVEFRCQVCGETECLEVHHLTYERLGNEDPTDLIVICRGHHWIEDMKRKDPSLFLSKPKITLPKLESVERHFPIYCKKARRLQLRLNNMKRNKNKSDKAFKNYKRTERKYYSHLKFCEKCKL